MLLIMLVDWKWHWVPHSEFSLVLCNQAAGLSSAPAGALK